MQSTETPVKHTEVEEVQPKDEKALTAFQEKAIAMDAFNTTKRGQAIGTGNVVLKSIGGIVGSFFVFVLAFLTIFVPIFGTWIAILIGLSGLYMLITNIRMLFFSTMITAATPMKKTIELECPYCSEKTQVFSKTNKKLCTNCNKVMLYLKERDSSSLEKLKCCYCKSEFAGPYNIEEFRCLNCGKKQKVIEGKIENVTENKKSCPKCAKKIDDSVYYCKHCNDIVNSSFADIDNGCRGEDIGELITVELRIGKSMLGHYVHANALADTIIGLLKEKIWIAGTNYSESIQLLRTLETIFESVEEAMEDENYVDLVAKSLLPKIDIAYALILTKVSREIDQHKVDELQSKREDTYAYFKELPFIDSRNRVLEKIRSKGNEHSRYSFTDWDKNLFDIVTTNSYYNIKDGERIRQEIEKIDEQLLETDYSVRDLSSIFEKWKCEECSKEESGVKISDLLEGTKNEASIEKIQSLLPPETTFKSERYYFNFMSNMCKCESCGMIICIECANSSMKDRITSGYGKEPCPSCSSNFGNGPVLVNVKSK